MNYLLAISIGPVQEFIAAGRRTADLYAGSELIAQCARAAARSIGELHPGSLIFPADPETGAANKILAEVDGDPAAAAGSAESAAKQALTGAWEDALALLCTEQRACVNEPLGVKQIHSFLQFYASWLPCSGSYQSDRRKVELLLAGRKSLRDFKQPDKNNVAKSPLDPSRDTVLRIIGAEFPPCLAQEPLRLKPGESLDAVSLVKRVRKGEPTIDATHDASLDAVSLVKRVRGSAEGVQSTGDIAARAFLADHPEVATHIGAYPERAIYKSLRDELRDEGKLPVSAHSRIEAAMRGREPGAYFAILRADGDGIGAMLDAQPSKQDHQAFSRLLSAFTARAETIVEANSGHLIYAGGDDVLAFLPIHTSLCCAAQLAAAFTSTGCRLSVGVAILHYHEPLYYSLRRAETAERAAKEEGGNRLRLAVCTRGGQTVEASVGWNDMPGLDSWKDWVTAFQIGEAGGLPYEVARLAREFRGTTVGEEAIRGEARRIFGRKTGWAGEGEARNLDRLLAHVSDAATLQALAEKLVVFRWMAGTCKSWHWEGDR